MATRSNILNYHYQAYGLIFCSDRELPELPVYNLLPDNQIDVHIRQGDVPEALDNPVSTGVLYEASANTFLLKLQDIGHYLIRNGNEIIIQPAANACPNDIRVFMLGSGFGALLHQRQMLVMHASAIHTDFGAVLFCGNSGVGKSTLLGEMLRRDYPMMVDDVCAVVLDDAEQPIVLPGYPRTRLWADSAAKLEVDTDGLQKTRPTLDKFERQLPEQFYDQSAPMHRIYLLGTSNSDEIELTPLQAIDTFSTVLHNTYRNTFLDGLEMRGPHFSMVSKVATTVPVNRVVRPSAAFRLTELANLIEADFQAT